MSENNQDLENQGQGEGEQNPNAEFQAKLEQMEQEKNALREELEREKRVNQLLEEMTPQQEPTYEPEPSIFGDPEVDKKLNSYVENKFQQYVRQSSELNERKMSEYVQAQKIEQMYFDKFPTHASWKREVGQISNEFANEMGNKIHAIPLEKRMEEVAKRTNDYISKIKARVDNPTLHVEGGSTSQPTTTKKVVDSGPQTEDERAKEAFQDIKDMRNNKSLRR